MSFPKDFIWGAASAAAQIEGAWDEDGRTPSIWDLMPPGKISKNETCHVACDHYHRYKEDVAIMKELGLQAYRFSVSWSRVIPARGVVNPLGLKFYNDLVDELLAAGIRPMITLFHSDLPQWCVELGGWLNEEIAEDFAFFARTMAEALSDRVAYWFTLNEPQCFQPDFLEYIGKKGDAEAEKTAWRNILRSHGRAVQELRAAAKQPLKLGMVTMGMPIEAIPGALDEEKAYQLACSDMAGYQGVARWCDPMILGTVPQAMEGVLSEADLKLIHQPLDLFPVNAYGSFNFYYNPSRPNPLIYPGMPKSQIGMPFRPRCLYYVAKHSWRRYGLPVLFTENGFSNIDFVMRDGKVHDPQRTDYIYRYLKKLRCAVEEGVPVVGYLYWSILDNFEWFHGYDMRFGLVYVDYQTQKRTVKDSAWDYAEIIRQNGENV
ncbi:MAG: family 1 glycosylhydrolase [Oscillospiraceae bacterium]|nr:family 1 glycosylhydrolase [Oscillospiraceae bacterium]